MNPIRQERKAKPESGGSERECRRVRRSAQGLKPHGFDWLYAPGLKPRPASRALLQGGLSRSFFRGFARREGRVWAGCGVGSCAPHPWQRMSLRPFAGGLGSLPRLEQRLPIAARSMRGRAAGRGSNCARIPLFRFRNCWRKPRRPCRNGAFRYDGSRRAVSTRPLCPSIPKPSREPARRLEWLVPIREWKGAIWREFCALVLSYTGGLLVRPAQV